MYSRLPISPRRTRNRSRFLTVFFLIVVLLLVRQIATIAEPLSVSGRQSTQPVSSLAADYFAVEPNAPKPPVFAKNFALMDGLNGDILIGQRIDDSIPIASTTKMVTALVAVREMSLDKVVTISSRPPTAAGSRINLRTGERITVGNLIKGLLISSGNDAAFALAEAYSGKEGEYQPFLDAMNKTVRSYGLTHSTFYDPAGLDDERGRSTVRELAHIARIVLQIPSLREVILTPQATIASVDGQTTHELKNTNRLIQADTAYYLPNALGVKTGFTHDAGHCLVSAYKIGDRTLIGVVMNTVEYTTTASANESKKLYLWAEKYLTLRQYLH